MIHEKSNIQLDGNIIEVDKGFEKVIPLLNKCGYKTSGCCIGEEGYAWVNIQEIDENKMIYLSRVLGEHRLQKEIYTKNDSSEVYVHYILKTPEIDVEDRIRVIKSWEETLEAMTHARHIQESTVYKTMDLLFLTKTV